MADDDRQAEAVKATFRKSERLCSKVAITELVQNGTVVSHYPFRLHYSCSSYSKGNSPAQIVISVPKRNFKRAVKRNLLKRRIREAYRLNKSSLYQQITSANLNINILLVYVSAEILPYQQLEQKLIALLQRLAKRLEKSVDISAGTTS